MIVDKELMSIEHSKHLVTRIENNELYLTMFDE